MTTPRQWRANRINARSSTGPRSNEGKARSAHNARRHGLSIPIAADPQLGAEAEALAHEIARGHTVARAIELSRGIAEAQVDLYRAREVRHALLQHALADTASPARAQWPPSDDLGTERTSGRSPERDAQIMAQALADLSQKLHAVRRYEARALARRKFAIRAFNSALKEHVGAWAGQPSGRSNRIPGS
jgi:hypothetical protein